MKVIIRIVLFVGVFGGWMVQLNFLGRSVSSNTRRFYVMALLVIEAIPIFLIGFYHNPSRRKPKSTNRTENNKDFHVATTSGSQKIQTGFSASGVLQVLIDPPRTPYTKRFITLVAVIGAAEILGLQFIPLHLGHQLHSNHILAFHGMILVVQAITLLAAGWILAIACTERTRLTVDSERLEVTRQVLNLPVSRRSFANREVVNLRYEHWQVEGRYRTVARSGLRFEAGPKSCQIGRCISESQANTLINEMRKLYPYSVVP
ncbi:MAG: hypothetical protein EPN47_01665 [Acidobacteria bacterium]|nr:MAG: hypothetical protein EPN47_01665 [Acidobacteriota bacterium]